MVEKTWIRKAKFLGAVLLALAFLLPISRCEKVDYSVSEEGTLTEEVPAGEEVYEYSYAYEDVSFEDPASLLVPIAFFWPVLVLGYLLKGKSQKVETVFSYVSILLSGGSIFVIFGISIFGELYIGAYVGIAGAVIFLVVSGVEAIAHIRMRLSTVSRKG